ncbi:MAG: GNAT family N-acetyltransferase [Candidatus Heimdallarchaeota archaeon]
MLDNLKEKSGFFEDGWFVLGPKNQPIASAIVLLNKSHITEGYLDWIQVSPNYRGNGIGKQIVSESIRRIINNSENNRIITVVGETNNPTNPLSLYKSIGFDKISKWTLFQ